MIFKVPEGVGSVLQVWCAGDFHLFPTPEEHQNSQTLSHHAETKTDLKESLHKNSTKYMGHISKFGCLTSKHLAQRSCMLTTSSQPLQSLQKKTKSPSLLSQSMLIETKDQLQRIPPTFHLLCRPISSKSH